MLGWPLYATQQGESPSVSLQAVSKMSGLEVTSCSGLDVQTASVPHGGKIRVEDRKIGRDGPLESRPRSHSCLGAPA